MQSARWSLPAIASTLCLWLAQPAVVAQNQPIYDGRQPGQNQMSGQPGGGYSQYGQQYAPGYSSPYLPGNPQTSMPGQFQNQGGQSNYPQMPTGQAPPMYQTPGSQPGSTMSVQQWFSQYDQIRHQAQMSPPERQRADQLLSKGLSVLVPGEQKQATKALLTGLVVRYQRACQELRALPLIGPTANLQQSYFQYFATAGQLFGDYARVQDNLFITDASTGQPLAASLLQRKQMLEALEHQCKMLDAQTRQQLGIAPYPW